MKAVINRKDCIDRIGIHCTTSIDMSVVVSMKAHDSYRSSE